MVSNSRKKKSRIKLDNKYMLSEIRFPRLLTFNLQLSWCFWRCHLEGIFPNIIQFADWDNKSPLQPIRFAFAASCHSKRLSIFQPLAYRFRIGYFTFKNSFLGLSYCEISEGLWNGTTCERKGKRRMFIYSIGLQFDSTFIFIYLFI